MKTSPDRKGMHTSRNLRYTAPSVFTRTDQNGRMVLTFFILSLAIHGAVFGAMLVFQDFSFPKPMPPVIQVDLVSFAPDPVLGDSGDQSEAPVEDGTVPVKAKTVKSKPKKVKHIKPDISLKTKPKNIKELMEKKQQKKAKPPEKKQEKKKEKKPEPAPKKAPEPEETLEKAREQLEKKVDEKNQTQIAEALRRLQKKVSDQGTSRDGALKGRGKSRGGSNLKPIDLYHKVIQFSLQQNWVYSDVLAGMDQQLEATILIKILASGEIRDIFFETRSGNRYLDESAKKAILKINPLPPLPSGMPSYDIGLKFSPKGVK